METNKEWESRIKTDVAVFSCPSCFLIDRNLPRSQDIPISKDKTLTKRASLRAHQKMIFLSLDRGSGPNFMGDRSEVLKHLTLTGENSAGFRFLSRITALDSRYLGNTS